MLVVQRFAGVLLQMQALDADADLFKFAVLVRPDFDDDFALADDRLIVLGNLVALRQIGIKVVLAGKDRAMVDRRLQPEPGAHRLFDTFLVDHRQHARHGRIDQADMVVRFAAEFARSAGKQLGSGKHLGVDLQADNDLPVAGGTGNQVFWIGIAGFGNRHGAVPVKRVRRVLPMAGGRGQAFPAGKNSSQRKPAQKNRPGDARPCPKGERPRL